MPSPRKLRRAEKNDFTEALALAVSPSGEAVTVADHERSGKEYTNTRTDFRRKRSKRGAI
jgi:hypothetical protein